MSQSHHLSKAGLSNVTSLSKRHFFEHCFDHILKLYQFSGPSFQQHTTPSEVYDSMDYVNCVIIWCEENIVHQDCSVGQVLRLPSTSTSMAHLPDMPAIVGQEGQKRGAFSGKVEIEIWGALVQALSSMSWCSELCFFHNDRTSGIQREIFSLRRKGDGHVGCIPYSNLPSPFEVLQVEWITVWHHTVCPWHSFKESWNHLELWGVFQVICHETNYCTLPNSSLKLGKCGLTSTLSFQGLEIQPAEMEDNLTSASAEQEKRDCHSSSIPNSWLVRMLAVWFTSSCELLSSVNDWGCWRLCKCWNFSKLHTSVQT